MSQDSTQGSKPSATTERSVNLAPSHRDLYLLIVGLLAGVILGPGVLGQLSPWGYDKLWLGGGTHRSELVAFDKQQADTIARLEASGATPAATAEKRAELQTQRVPLEARLLLAQKQHRQWLQGRSAALVLATLVLMVVEAMLGSMPGGFWEKMRYRLATARYALMALWIMLLLAEPSAVTDGSLISFVMALVIVCLLLVSVPLGWAHKLLAPKSPDSEMKK